MVRVKQTMQLKIVQGKYRTHVLKTISPSKWQGQSTYFTTFIIYTPSVHHCVYEMCVLVINLSVIFSLKCTGNRISKYEQDVISDEQTNGGWGPQY